MATTSATSATIADLEQVEGRCELVNGEIVRMGPTGGDHGFAAGAITEHLRTFVRTNRLGRVTGSEPGFILSRNPDTVRAADATFIAAALLQPGRSYPGFFAFAPTLAVEVLSPSDRYTDVHAKVRAWLAAGTRVVWVIDPAERRVAIHTVVGAHELGEDATLDGGDVLPGFALPVRELFT